MTDSFVNPWHGVETAGSAALSFANTLDWRLRPEPEELLRTYDDLLRWARTESMVTPDEARRLRSWGEEGPASAARALRRAIQAREAMAELYGALAAGRTLPGDALASLDRICSSARSAQALRAEKGAPVWQWREHAAEPDRPLWGAALAAAELLTGPDRGRIRQCADDECGWFFLDTSKNRSRRWCSMESCGNRNKARRFYRKSRGG